MVTTWFSKRSSRSCVAACKAMMPGLVNMISRALVLWLGKVAHGKAPRIFSAVASQVKAFGGTPRLWLHPK